MAKDGIKKKEKKGKYILISFLVALVLLALVTLAAFLYQSYKNVVFDKWMIIISDIVGFIIVFFITYLFIRPKKVEKEDTWGING